VPTADDLVAGSSDPLVVADRDGIRFVIFNRPSARNALNRSMRADFAVLLARADADEAVKALVVTGAARCFSAGVDLKDRPPGAPPVEPNPGAALRAFAKPVVAAVDGFCITGALEIALSCAFVVATPDARFADTHCRNGLFPRWGGGRLLTGAIGARRARQMMLAGTLIDSPTALAWGLVNEIVPTASLLRRAGELAAAMAEQARQQPLAYALHAAMLDAIDSAGTAADIERAMLDRFDHSRHP